MPGHTVELLFLDCPSPIPHTCSHHCVCGLLQLDTFTYTVSGDGKVSAPGTVTLVPPSGILVRHRE